MADLNWIINRYNTMLSNFNDREFSRDEVIKLLKEKYNDNEGTVDTLISEMKKQALITSYTNEYDKRSVLYKLNKDFGLLKYTNNKITRSDLESMLKKAADLIRTRVDYKYILILLFLKRISDKWEEEYNKAFNELVESGLNESEAGEEAKNEIYHEFNLPEDALWNNIRKDVNTLPEKLAKALKTIAEMNPDLRNVIDNIDFMTFTTNSENSQILRQLVELFSEQELNNVSPDILGDAYEWILRYFLPQKAKEGEIYTPREVIKLLMNLLDPKSGDYIYDPACGTAGMLITAYYYVKDKYGKDDANKLFLYGQEANTTIYAVSKMNLYIHGIDDTNLSLGDTLLHPKNIDENKFDIVVANPPWNQDGYDENVLKSGEYLNRYKYGFTNSSSADWAWVQHMLYTAKSKVGIILDTGSLFRSGKELAIRSKIIDNDFVESVILLPEKIFYNTGSPSVIIILNKNKNVKNKILFIDASKEFIKHPEIRKLNTLSCDNINKITEAYRQFKNMDNFASVVDLNKIRENNYDLNIQRYVGKLEDNNNINVKNVLSEIKNLDLKLDDVNKKLDDYLSGLGYYE